jgi:hypothetical protein
MEVKREKSLQGGAVLVDIGGVARLDERECLFEIGFVEGAEMVGHDVLAFS